MHNGTLSVGHSPIKQQKPPGQRSMYGLPSQPPQGGHVPPQPLLCPHRLVQFGVQQVLVAGLQTCGGVQVFGQVVPQALLPPHLPEQAYAIEQQKPLSALHTDPAGQALGQVPPQPSLPLHFWPFQHSGQQQVFVAGLQT